jgi:hypothetical protein
MGAAGAAAPPQHRNKKKLVDLMISNILNDLPSSQNHPLKSADD